MNTYQDRFLRLIASGCPVLTEGAVLERLRRAPSIRLDSHVANAGLVLEEAGRKALTAIYRQYLEVGRAYDLPMVLLTPTWRANPDRLRAAGLPDVHRVNRECFLLLDQLRDQLRPHADTSDPRHDEGPGAADNNSRNGDGSYADSVYIGGLIGCHGDAYNPLEALPADRATAFHRQQVSALAESGVDFLIASTLPALSEAQGIAVVMAETGRPYVLSFIIRPDGTLLDGTPLDEAIRRIDAEVSTPPLVYLVNCVHPANFGEALSVVTARDGTLSERLIGLQGNTSRRSPEELDNRRTLDEETPEAFAAEMLRLRQRFGTRILGGCCGTDHRHIACIARMLLEPEKSTPD